MEREIQINIHIDAIKLLEKKEKKKEEVEQNRIILKLYRNNGTIENDITRIETLKDMFNI